MSTLIKRVQRSETKIIPFIVIMKSGKIKPGNPKCALVKL